MSNNTEFKIKPLTDADVAQTIKRIADADANELNDIYNKYANAILSILTMGQKQTKDEDELVELDRLKRIINLTPSDERFIRTKDKVWAVREHIINKNAKFFIERDYSAAIKKDHNQGFIETLISIIKYKFTQLTKTEQDFYWKKAAILLNCVARFKKAVGEFDE
jgi:predicted choloylglycine hydrolase